MEVFMYYTVYKITNKINGKIYIGKHQTKKIDDGYMGSGKRLKDAIKHYGLKNFEKEILFVFDNEEDMNNKEAELVTECFIKEDSNYNMCPGGNGGFGYINNNNIPKFKGKKHTKKTKKKLSELNIGKDVSEETRQKISESNKRTNKSRGEKTSKANKGKFKTEEHRRKIAAAIKKWHAKKSKAPIV
jgi:hypothetical protein